MASIITATVASGLTQSADNSGVLQLASGTGNLVTVPSVTGTAMVSGNMPAFSAYLGSNQSVSSGVNTKVQCNTEEFDTASAYDSATNYRFTPLVAGYYQFNWQLSCRNSTNISRISCTLYKNGSSFKNGVDIYNANSTTGYKVTGSALVYANGTTDYFEFYGQVQTTAGTNEFTAGSGVDSYFQGYLARTA